MRRKKPIYWIATAIAAFFLLISATTDLIQAAWVLTAITHLGYPTYLLPIMGVAKVLALAAILSDKSKMLSEWAYAGLTIDMTGAVLSHLLAGDGISGAVPAIIVMSLVLSSYVLRQERS